MTDRADGKMVTLTTDTIKSIATNERIKNPIEQIDNLIIWTGQSTQQPALGRNTTIGGILSVVGAAHTREDFTYLGQTASKTGYATIITTSADLGELEIRINVTLTIEGWERFVALQQRQSDTRRAFMAMQFGNVDLDRAYQDCFRIGVADAGFSLRRLDEGQGTGLIDDQMRVAIRTARFMLADLSSGNSGAYWEAGFAEGLGKPVLYLCQKEAWDDATRRPHFDTNHLMTVIWSMDNLPSARRKIADAIRNTFPADSNMPDA